MSNCGIKCVCVKDRMGENKVTWIFSVHCTVWGESQTTVNDGSVANESAAKSTKDIGYDPGVEWSTEVISSPARQLQLEEMALD